MIIFLTVFIGRSLHLRYKKDIRLFKLGVGKSGLQQVVEISFFIILTAWVLELFFHITHLEFRIFPAIFQVVIIDAILLKWLGVILSTIGFVYFIGALISFKDSWRIGIDSESNGDLVTGGFFAVSRNPIFVFLDLYLIGTFLLNGTLGFLILAIAIVLGLHYQILQEEKFLLRAHGQAYQAYCSKTRRYFG